MKINHLQSKLQNKENHLSSSISNVSSEVQNIYANVDEKLKRQSSIIDAIHYELGEADKSSLTVPVTFTLVPKEITKGSAVTLKVADQSFVMKCSNGTSYTAIVPLSIFNTSTPEVIIDNGDILRSEQLTTLSIESIKEAVLPILYAHLDGQATYRSEEYSCSGSLELEFKQADPKNTFSEIHLVIDVNGKVISDKKISPNRKWHSLCYEINEKISLKNDQTCTMTVIAIDTLGLEHHYMVDYWKEKGR